MSQLSHLTPDPFEVYHAAHSDKLWWRWCAVICFSLNCVLLGLLVKVCNRPPAVIVKDRLMGEAATVVQAGNNPPKTVDDARVFFLNMVRLRYGWDSMTVMRDYETFRDACISDQRELDDRYMREQVSQSPDDPDHKVARLHHWITSNVKNTLLLPNSLDGVDCVASAQGPWNCYLTATVVTQRLFPPYIQNPPQRRSTFVAQLLPVDHTIHTPYGLVVGILRELPATEKGS